MSYSNGYNYWTRVFQRRLSRRGVLRAGAAGTAGLSAALALGCGEGERPAATATTTATATTGPATATPAAEQARHGGAYVTTGGGGKLGQRV